jgi:hypothetical protein
LHSGVAEHSRLVASDAVSLGSYRWSEESWRFLIQSQAENLPQVDITKEGALIIRNAGNCNPHEYIRLQWKTKQCQILEEDYNKKC